MQTPPKDNRFEFVVIAGKRARQLLAGALPMLLSPATVMAQDEGSCAVWGMPRAVAEAGLACAIMPPAKLARRVTSRVREASCR